MNDIYDQFFRCSIHDAVGNTYSRENHDVVGCPFCLQRHLNRIAAENSRLKRVRCPDNRGGLHRWDGDGQCKDCCNYATDLIDKALQDKET